MKHWIFIKRCLILIVFFFILDFIISIILIKGLNKNYGFGKHPDILINGSSMSLSGFNKNEIEKSTGKSIATYSHEGVSVIDRYAMIKHFFHLYPKGIQTVVYEINPILLSNVSSAENVYTLFYPYMDDKTIDNYIKERAGAREYYINKIIRTKRFDARLIRSIIMGYLGKYENIKTNSLDSPSLLPLIAKKGMIEIALKNTNIEVFESTMNLIRSHNADIILVMMPMYYIKLNTFHNDDYKKLCMYLEDYCSSREDIKFLDLNQDSIIYNASYFSDPLHFNVYGQEQITNIVSAYLIGEKEEDRGER